MKRTAVLRADASPAIGGGHVMRCRSLATALAAEGWTYVFASRKETRATVGDLVAGVDWLVLDCAEHEEAGALQALRPEGCDLLVVDHYGRDRDFERQCRPWARRLLVIDDIPDREHDCDFLVDVTLGRTAADYAALVPESCHVLAGPDHALLRPEFARLRPLALGRRADSTGIGRILVALGAVDMHDLTPMVLEGVAHSGLEAVVEVVGGADTARTRFLGDLAERVGITLVQHRHVRDIASLMVSADVAIGAAGSSSWERCCLGLPTVMMVVADNQTMIAESLAAAGAASNLGWYAGVTPDTIGASLVALTDPKRRLAMAEAAAAVCDGLGAGRVAAAVSASREDRGA